MNSVLSAEKKTFNFSSYLKYLINSKKADLLYYRRFSELKKIMNHCSLDTYFQPIVHFESGETFGFEALNRPEASKLFPSTDIFYDFVGQTNIVFLFECFCRNLSLQRFIDRLRKESCKKNFVLFLNIHPHVLLDKNYHSGETLQLLKEIGIKPQQVVFELTEKSAVTDFQEFERVLSHYRSQGYRIAIDDVGSGYNSLKTLIYLKPEFIKLDRSLIQHIDQHLPQQQLVSLIIDYAQQSGTKVIAEGIERLEEIAYLKANGCHYGQGYAIGRPNKEIKVGKLPISF